MSYEKAESEELALLKTISLLLLVVISINNNLWCFRRGLMM